MMGEECLAMHNNLALLQLWRWRYESRRWEIYYFQKAKEVGHKAAVMQLKSLSILLQIELQPLNELV